MSKAPNNVPPKAAKVLGIGQTAKKPTGIASVAKKITTAVKGKPAPTSTFKAADPKTTGKMKPGTPIIGASRGGNTATSASINSDRMKGIIKKTGM